MANKVEKPKVRKVWYAVELNQDPTSLDDNVSPFETVEEAYDDEIMKNGKDGKKYAFKIELLGEVKQSLEIVKI